MHRTFIQVSALLLTLFAGVMLVRGSFALSPKDIAGLSSTYVGYNPSLIKSLSQQQADTKVGVMLLIFSAMLQMANLLWPMRIGDFAVNINGVFIAVIISTLIFVLALKVSIVLSARTQKKVINILSQEEK